MISCSTSPIERYLPTAVFHRGELKQMPENHYAISPEGKRLLLGLLLTHKDYLETEGEANDESELDLTDSLIELFEEN
jgi:hypothetical protein